MYLSQFNSGYWSGDLKAYSSLVTRFQDMAVGYAYHALGDFHLTDGMPEVAAYRKAVMARPAVRNAVLPSYAEELMAFCLRRQSHLGDLARAGAGAAA